ncbi:hypothetical protein [Bowmanella yangjiangensis]|uniref:GIY-YIG domain-containing protein n=1 Tax=Bowmanella yangjiangensis TaxID=2811230 RepID=A0ABS3CSI1_9ALTE|nr:hypothetical protein [Bowmanella yangjiangensis]MBN7820069.1 hypothetical protein [Bowmanella yangjiangensis]
MSKKSIEHLSWKDATPPQRLTFYARAPNSPGIYELGVKTQSEFSPKYLGSAADQSLRDRLSQHFRKSHNDNVELIKTRVWFRCIPTVSGEEARYLEGHYLAAFRGDYPWNKRHEWSQMFILEDIRESL